MQLKLKVVIWKNVLIRKRYWFSTATESLLPVAIFFLIAYAKSYIKELHKITLNNATYHEAVPISYTQCSEDVQLLFTPDNSYYQNIMQKTIEKFQLQSDRVYGFQSEQSLKDYYHKNIDNTIIAIIFKGNNKEHLDYTIRYYDQHGGQSEFLQTGHLFSNTRFQYQQHRDTDYLWKGFIPMQKAIDISFIEVNLGKDIDDQFNFHLKEFPYPPHKIDEEFTTTFIEYIPILTLFSFIFVCPEILTRVIEEKQTGTKELLKMNGMKSWMLWLGWFIYGMMPMLLAVTLIVVLMKLPLFGNEDPPIQYSDGSVLFCYLLLYCMAANIFCFAISSCFNNPSSAIASGMLIWILSYFIPKYSLGLDETCKYPWGINIILNIFPNMALHYGYSIMALYEEREIGLQWSNIGKSSSGSSEDITLLNVFIMLFLDMVIYMLFTLYMDRVNPGEYGVKDSPLFIWKKFKKLFARKTLANFDEEDVQPMRPSYVEDSQNMKHAIVIKNLLKKFEKISAVNKLNLNIYKYHITVLLGHNGAGKSTTMSMITGMLEPTSGSILVNNMDMRTNQDEIRSMMGFCPQHNYLFPDLTVKEHLVFFAKLKGKSALEASIEADMLLQELQIDEKANQMALTLSGGMKRKLCLAMAAIGDSSILVLDEPSSGMDTKSRRDLWNILLKWRMKKTILITTHSMEEADILGDLIAIMANGNLNCYGTPMWLKRKFETGYHLSLTITDHTNDDDIRCIKTFIMNHISKSYFKSQNGNNLIFILPFESKQVSSFVCQLEQVKEYLRIESFCLTPTTLEDVFLKTSCRVVAKDEKPEGSSNNEMAPVMPVEASKRRNLQIKTLFKKRILFFWKMKYNYIFLFFIAWIFFWLTTYFSTTSRNKYFDNGVELQLNLNLYKVSSVFVNSTNDVETTKYKNIYKQLIDNTLSSVLDVENVENEILKTAKENIIYYKEHVIINSEFINSSNGVDMYALYNSFALHSSPISLNLLTNTIAKSFLGDTFSISVSNWPLEPPNPEFHRTGFSEIKIALLWVFMLPSGCLFILGCFLIFPHAEINSNFLQIQYMCGVAHYLYWIVNLLTDLVVYLLLMGVLAITVCFLSTPFQGVQEFLVLYFILFLYGISGIPCTYLFCRNGSASGALCLLVVMGMFLGIVMTFVVGLLSESGDEYYEYLSRWLKIVCFLFIPQVGISHLLKEFSMKAVNNYNMDALPQQMMRMCIYNPNPCCSSMTSNECSEFRDYMNNLDLWYLMIMSAVIFFTINIFLDSYYLRNRLSKLLFKIKLLSNKDDQLNNTIKENVRSQMALSSRERLTVDNISKCYSGKPVVKNVSIKLRKQECLGILGVNGAGKTTTFRMLTRDIFMDRGEIDLTVNEKKVDIENNKYMENIGYCPQDDFLVSHFTGREILEVVAKLRGIDDPKIVDTILNCFELTEYANIPCGHYSGGNKRKLSLAISLVGFPPFVLLDEPTNGVDPSARRKLWSVIKNAQKNKNSSFILTSHSMEECEALCSRLKIMKDGEFKKEGSIQELKKEFGGFNVKVNLKNKSYDDVHCVIEMERTDATPNTHLDRIKEKIRKQFKNIAHTCDIKDENTELLQCYIKGEQLSWSEILNELEDLKAENIIEDYTISGASLEDVFLSVAKE